MFLSIPRSVSSLNLRKYNAETSSLIPARFRRLYSEFSHRCRKHGTKTGHVINFHALPGVHPWMIAPGAGTWHECVREPWEESLNRNILLH
jgi:hypothetical protein